MENVEEYRGDPGEDQVEKEAIVRFEAEDACRDAVQGGCQAVEVGDGLQVKSG